MRHTAAGSYCLETARFDMTEREKLINLLLLSNDVPTVLVEEVADFLLLHGVTIKGDQDNV